MRKNKITFQYQNRIGHEGKKSAVNAKDRGEGANSGEEEEEEGNEAWSQARSRLDAMSRETAARDASPYEIRTRWDPPPVIRRRDATRTESGVTSSLARRNSRGWRRSNHF